MYLRLSEVYNSELLRIKFAVQLRAEGLRNGASFCGSDSKVT